MKGVLVKIRASNPRTQTIVSAVVLAFLANSNLGSLARYRGRELLKIKAAGFSAVLLCVYRFSFQNCDKHFPTTTSL